MIKQLIIGHPFLSLIGRENIEDVHTKELENKLSSRELDLSELKKSKEEVEKKLTAVTDEKTLVSYTKKNHQRKCSRSKII